VPVISDLRIVSAQSSQPTVELRFAATDESADLGDLPYVWFTIGCGGDPALGVVRGRVTAGETRNVVVRATVPHPRTSGTSATARCDLQVRATDSIGSESNTLKATVDFRN